jgi:16S rRNA (cytidine1402-2'-O)-methyltransferase
MSEKKGELFIIATPIGNLEDMTFRAIRVLKEADLIAAEDTRHSAKLLRHYGISTGTTSYFEHNEKAKGREIIKRLLDGKSVALITDAGTPAISDPGYRLVKLAVENNIRVTAVPGASALTAALSVSALPTDDVRFMGFVPSSGGDRGSFLKKMRGVATTFVFYDSPGRLLKTLNNILELLGDLDIVIARELTKLHEELIRGKVSEVIEKFDDKKLRGEITVILRGVLEEHSLEEAQELLRGLLQDGASVRDAARVVADDTGFKKAELYKMALKIKEESVED